MSKHTEGPWKVGGVDATVIYACSSLQRVANTFDSYGRTLDELQANARLIAAAPELLDALIGILDAAENFYIEGAVNPDKCKDIQAARTAIAKANGETQ